MKPCTSSLFAPLNVNDSNGCMSIFDNSASFMWVTGLDSRTTPSIFADRSIRQISLAQSTDIRVKKSDSSLDPRPDHQHAAEVRLSG